jgi:signal transduction histidine kinase
MEISAKQKSIGMSADLSKTAGAMVAGDPTRIKQICANLVSNAIKFTEQGHVEISTHLVRRSKSLATLSISVKDTGIGLNEQQISTLFLPFQQADSSTTRRFGGTGLGLSISQKLAHAMGGEITVTSQLGEGSHFIVSL